MRDAVVKEDAVRDLLLDLDRLFPLDFELLLLPELDFDLERRLEPA